MNRATATQLGRSIEHHRIQLQQIQKELATSGGRRIDDQDAARDVALAVAALARASIGLSPRREVQAA